MTAISWHEGNTYIEVFIRAESNNRHCANLALWTRRQWWNVATSTRQRLNQHLILIYRLLYFLHINITSIHQQSTKAVRSTPMRHHSLYAVSQATIFLFLTLPDTRSSFTWSKFAVIRSLKIPQHLKHVTILPCKTLVRSQTEWALRFVAVTIVAVCDMSDHQWVLHLIRGHCPDAQGMIQPTFLLKTCHNS